MALVQAGEAAAGLEEPLLKSFCFRQIVTMPKVRPQDRGGPRAVPLCACV